MPVTPPLSNHRAQTATPRCRTCVELLDLATELAFLTERKLNGMADVFAHRVLHPDDGFGPDDGLDDAFVLRWIDRIRRDAQDTLEALRTVAAHAPELGLRSVA